MANLQGANLWAANLQGAYLSLNNLQGTNGLTQEQLDAAKGDEWTEPPAGLSRPAHWPPDTTYEEYNPY